MFKDFYYKVKYYEFLYLRDGESLESSSYLKRVKYVEDKR